MLVAAFLSYVLAATALSPRAYFDAASPARRSTGRRPAGRRRARSAATGAGPLRTVGLARRPRRPRAASIDGSSVNDEFGRRIGVSLRLLVIGTILGTGLGVLAGVWSAVRQYRLSDRTVTLISFVLLSTPTFLLAVLLKIGALALNQTSGRQVISFTGEKTPGLNGPFAAVFADRAVHLLLPTLSIGLITLASYSRYQRSAMLDVLGSDYLRTAEAKGLSRRRVLVRHGLRTALIPMSTFFSFGFLGILTGATFTEKIFGWHGMGEWFIDSINNNDVNAVVAVNLFAAGTVLLSGLLADLLHAALDPRVRRG